MTALGLFSRLLGGGGAPVAADVVWASLTAKRRGLVTRARERAEEGAVLVLAHFPSTLDALMTVPAAPWARLERDFEVSGLLSAPRAGAVGAALATSVPPPSGAGADGEVSVLVAERHFLRRHDQRLIETLAAYPVRPAVEFHTSLEDPLLSRLEMRIQQLLERLGADPDEAFESPLVAKAIERVQAEAERRAAGDMPAASPEEWLRANLPI